MNSMEESKNKESILVICLGFTALFLMTDKLYFLYLAFGIGLLSLLSKWAEQKVVWSWFKIGHLLGWVNSKILLSAMFILMIIPLAFIKKLLGKPSIQMKKKEDSYYHTRDHQYSKKDLENIW